jgi:hypothetical protein
MVFAAIWAHGILPYRVAKESGAFALPILFYGVVLAAVMALGMLFYCADEKKGKGTQKIREV